MMWMGEKNIYQLGIDYKGKKIQKLWDFWRTTTSNRKITAIEDAEREVKRVTIQTFK